MIAKRVLRYGIAFLCVFLVVSLICIYEHRDFLASYFSSSLSYAAGIILYLLIYGVGIGLILKSLFK